MQVVAAALFDDRGQVLLAERPPGKHMAGYWEFPGGKLMDGESEQQALARELHEELGLIVHAAAPFMRLTHDYPDRTVELSMWLVARYSGVPQPLDGQRLRWVAPALLPAQRILDADRPFIEALQQRADAGAAARTVTLSSRHEH
jgi:8-oxo-dGTP diphosphatase